MPNSRCNGLTDLGVLHRLDRRVGGVRAGSASGIYALGPAGQWLAARDDGARRRRPSEPGLPYVAHTLAISELRILFEEADRSGAFRLLDFEAEPECWRTFFGSGGARLRLKPDAFVRVARGEVEELAFVEVDLGTESTTALKTKFRAYRSYWSAGREQARWDGTFPRVLFLAPNARRLGKLIDVAASQPPESWKIFSVRLYDEAVATFSERVDS